MDLSMIYLKICHAFSLHNFYNLPRFLILRIAVPLQHVRR